MKCLISFLLVMAWTFQPPRTLSCKDVDGDKRIKTLSITEENKLIQKVLLGNWVNELLLIGLNSEKDFQDTEQWFVPFRSFTFLKKNETLDCIVETDFETFDRKPATIEIQKINDSIYDILILKQSEGPIKWQFNETDTSIIIGTGAKKNKYKKFDKVKLSTIDPLPYVYNWTLLQGNYSIRNSNNEIISDKISIDKGKVSNFKSMKFISVAGDIEYLLRDKTGNKYIKVIYNEKINEHVDSLSKKLAYTRKNGMIYLYDFVYSAENKFLIDSLVLKYIFIKK